ncbi:ABC transporter ATP-binding protein [Arthrobacter sp. ZGTC131]|uniref:ATP-binding cassette domain-containing protein n=1 Tax=Arthrobacter sp. ZGTC131 TaxID=2058898 RepID=UPI000CE4FCE8|nr:ABC transporter ATP-binding protein [Arthrobacter sp. ZGTC131]
MPEGLIIEKLRVGHRADSRQGSPTPILSEMDLSVAPGEFVALVGTSGSGKTMTALSVLGLLPPQIHVESGSIRLGGTDLRAAGEAELNRVRGGRIGMLFQQPKRMFNPRRTIGNHLAEPLQLHRRLRGRSARMQALDLLAEAGFEDPAWCARAYPHQLSGGMAQRAMLAVAMAGRPELLLADEPTSALDKVLELQILELIGRQRHSHGLGVLYITHDLATVSAFADRVVVMEAGSVQESGPVRTVLDSPRTTCTKDLLRASALPAAPAPSDIPSRTILDLQGVTKRFRSTRRGARPALEGVSLDFREGEILGILGQSGSGKSTLARLILGLETPESGSITRFPGTKHNRAGITGTEVQLVFQEPHDVFDPRMKLRTSLEAPLLQRPDCTAEDRTARIVEVVREVELDPALLDRYPSQCSGGQLQRLTIARALLLEPAVLICDEATSALDAVTQRKVLDLLLRLHRDRQLSLIMISHDMNVIRYMSHRVAVLFQGALVEVAPTAEFFARPRHGHSKELVAAALPVPQAARACQHVASTIRVPGVRDLVGSPDAR